MAGRLLGVETEYAITALTLQGGSVDRAALLDSFMGQARKQLIHLPDLSHGMFLQNGARFYVDCGLHPEMSSPECTNPWDVVRYILAGERILSRLAHGLERQPSAVHQVMLSKCNVDYSGAQTTWGCHESYLHRSDPAVLSGHIIAHLVSRIIYTGAGGFNSLSPGLEFTLSPRAPHLSAVRSHNSTYARGIVHTKDETLAKQGYHRLHLICGESLCSETAMWLKLATTALVVAMAEAGACPGEGVELRSPRDALLTFAADIRCRETVEMADGRSMGAIEIQRHYLRQAQIYCQEHRMPNWAEEACSHWANMLDLLERAPQSVRPKLDWALRRSLYEDLARSRGMRWDDVVHWTRVLVTLKNALANGEYRGKPIGIDLLLGPQSPVRDQVKELGPYLRENGLYWDGLDPFLALRETLFEIDMKFGQLGDSGIFSSLDRAGVLAHHFPGVDRIEEAMTEPPSEGRARVRGLAIRTLAGVPVRSPVRYMCDWQGIWDDASHSILDLSDPFENTTNWRDLRAEQPLPGSLAEFIRFRQAQRQAGRPASQPQATSRG